MMELFDLSFENAQGELVDAVNSKTGLQQSVRILPLCAVNG